MPNGEEENLDAAREAAATMTEGEFFAQLNAIFSDLLSRQEPLGEEFMLALDEKREELYIDSADGK